MMKLDIKYNLIQLNIVILHICLATMFPPKLQHYFTTIYFLAWYWKTTDYYHTKNHHNYTKNKAGKQVCEKQTQKNRALVTMIRWKNTWDCSGKTSHKL